MSKRTIAALVLIETDDPLLDPDNLSVTTPGEAARLRQAVLRALPGTTSVVFVTSVEGAQQMSHAHAALLEMAGKSHLVVRPPAGYVPPRSE